MLFLAVQFIDVIWALFIFIGIEKAEISNAVPGTPLNLFFMPYTHSLIGAIFWSIIAFIIVRYVPIMKSRSFNKAIIIAAAVFSHWILDLLVHTSDLPLWLNEHKIGFGLYEHAMISFSLEVILIILGCLMYIGISSSKGMIGRIGVYVLIALLIVIGINSVWGISPPIEKVAAGFLLISYIIFSLMIAWIEKKRIIKS